MHITYAPESVSLHIWNGHYSRLHYHSWWLVTIE